LREGLGGQPICLGEVARISREIEYLKTVVTEFLEYARRPAPHRETFPARALLEEIAELFGGVPRIEADAGLTAGGDRGQLRRALLNLARNAVTAAGPAGSVVLGATATPSGVAWEVCDS